MARGLRKFLRSPGATLGVVIMLLAVTCALLASWFAVQNPFDLAALSTDLHRALGRIPEHRVNSDG